MPAAVLIRPYRLASQVRKRQARGARRRATGPTAVAARYDRRSGRVIVSLSSGVDVVFPPKKAQGLESAEPADLDAIEISPSGFGLHFPKLDADLYLPALLDGLLGSRRWMASRLGHKGRQSCSEAKAATSRAKGRLGGRPQRASR
ncbi:MAG: DUF2442 domain-containing protein [Proteobacteria bacterium]|nr:DUF2442 domain-containing protein [Pseudomonadota bacterium]MBI3496699.1 DUF2442 domain-containing protein [Pseudomonadota bacterium]